MRVMLDTNIFISAVVFNSQPMNRIIKLLAEKHSLVICSHIIDELHEVISEKFSGHKDDLEIFLLELPFELVCTPQTFPKHDFFAISDPDDEKILLSAILADVDVFVTGDKHFNQVEIERPEILSPVEFLSMY